MYQNIFWIVLTIVVILAGVGIIYLISILKKINNLIDTSTDDASKVVKDVQSSINDLKNITSGIDKKLDKTNELFNILHNVSRNLHRPANIISKAVDGIVVNLASFSYALKEGIKGLYRKKTLNSNPKD